MSEAIRRVYGRRRGRPLRPGQQARQDDLLPRLAIELPAGAPDPADALDPAALFARPPARLWLEIGFGGGEHLVAQAAANPDAGLIGCEVFANGIAKLLAEIERRGLDNLRIFADDARLLLDALPAATLDRVFILFPDPWPKTRHHKRRIVATATLDRLALLMRDGGELRLATDDPSYQVWMLDHLTRHPDFIWLARRAADWRERPPDWPATRYEAKARAAGRSPIFLRFGRRAR